MSINHPLTIRMLSIVLSLSKRWELDLPLEVQRIVGSLSPEAVYPAVMGSHPFFQDPQDMQANTPPIQRIQSQRSQPATNAVIPTSAVTQGPTFNTSDLFWSPFPDQAVLLEASHDGAPMEIAAMLDGRFNDWDQYQRDGVKVVSSIDALMGQPNMYDDWAQA